MTDPERPRVTGDLVDGPPSRDRRRARLMTMAQELEVRR
jgi:hypothetical protein